MIPRFMLAALCVLGPVCAAYGSDINGEATYISFSMPGALGTYPTGINASMEVTGYYIVPSTTARAFLRSADGSIINFSVPGATSTEPQGINAAGDVTGFYYVSNGGAQGFLRYADGRLVTFAENAQIYEGLQPTGINDFDVIAGNYLFHTQTAFTRSAAGVFSSIAPPNNQWDIQATAINASGSVVGYLGGPNDLYAGFVSHPDGYFSQFEVPANPVCANQTMPNAINAAGAIAGWYTTNYYNSSQCEPVNIGGFVMSPDGQLTLFHPPGTMAEFLEHLPEPGYTPTPNWISIDQTGDITGFSTDAAGVTHGFVRNPYGTITPFDPPAGKNTFPTSINDGGAIAGYYSYNAGSGPPVAFIRIPQ